MAKREGIESKNALVDISLYLTNSYVIAYEEFRKTLRRKENPIPFVLDYK